MILIQFVSWWFLFDFIYFCFTLLYCFTVSYHITSQNTKSDSFDFTEFFQTLSKANHLKFWKGVLLHTQTYISKAKQVPFPSSAENNESNEIVTERVYVSVHALERESIGYYCIAIPDFLTYFFLIFQTATRNILCFRNDC